MKQTSAEIKTIINKITGFDVLVRKGKGSMKGLVSIFLPLELSQKGLTFKPFESELNAIFDVDRLGFDIILIKAQ